MSLKVRAKELYTQVLAKKARRHLDSIKTKVILILGAPGEREVYKQVIASELARAGSSAQTNLPGNNYKLGASMTVLGFKGGYSSPFRWIQLLFIKPSKKSSDYLVMDFSYTKPEDLDFISNYLNPSAVIIPESSKLQINRLKLANAEIIFADQLIKIHDLKETERGQTCAYEMDGTAGTLELDNFGTHYIYSALIAKHLIYVQQKV